MATSTGYLRALDHLSHRIVSLTRVCLGLSIVGVMLAAWGLSTAEHIAWWVLVLAISCLGLMSDSRRLAYEQGALDERMRIVFCYETDLDQRD